MDNIIKRSGPTIPKDERKKILLLSDDLRMSSGVGVISRELVLHSCHQYNWVQLGASMVHPEMGKIMDAGASLSAETGVEDAYLRIFPYSGYGDINVLRTIIEMEKPDAIMHFTDPRYWIWLYQHEHEIRQKLPLLYYHVWDDLPFPQYNYNYYRSCDFIACISKQTYNIVRQVWKESKPWQVSYVQHGLNENIFYPITDKPEDLARVAETRKRLFGEDEVDFVVFYNNRNIARKQTSNVIMAFKQFWATLTPEQQSKARLVMHTQGVDDHGTNLWAVLKDLAPEIKCVIDETRCDSHIMNALFNIADVTINMASAEGFGLGTLESLLAGTPIIVNVTGGLQDQCGFRDEEGRFLDPDIHYGADWGSNHDGRYRTHGEWALPLFPTNRSLVGSPPTPYIFDDRCDIPDAAKAMREIYDMSIEERERRGALGREYAINEGFTSKNMTELMMQGIETTFKNWTPREKYNLIKA